MTYNFMVTEYLRRSVRVDADSREEAQQKVEALLASEKIVLGDADFADRDIDTVDEFEEKRGNYGTRLTNDEGFEVDDDLSERSQRKQ